MFGELSNVSLATGYEIAVYLAEWLVSMLSVSLNVEYELLVDFEDSQVMFLFIGTEFKLH